MKLQRRTFDTVKVMKGDNNGTTMWEVLLRDPAGFREKEFLKLAVEITQS